MQDTRTVKLKRVMVYYSRRNVTSFEKGILTMYIYLFYEASSKEKKLKKTEKTLKNRKCPSENGLSRRFYLG